MFFWMSCWKNLDQFLDEVLQDFLAQFLERVLDEFLDDTVYVYRKKAVATSALYGGGLVPYGFHVACQRASCCRAMTAFLFG